MKYVKTPVLNSRFSKMSFVCAGRSLSPTLRVYYVALEVASLNLILSVHVSYLLGMPTLLP